MATRTEKVQIVVSAKDKAKSTLGNIKGAVIGLIGAYAGIQIANKVFIDSIKVAAKYEATLQSLRSVVAVTGRDHSKVMKEMEKHLGGLASKASIAEGFLKGMTTELNPKQISQMTQAIKDASIAMGENFNYQLPLIIKAVKQLNPAILDNIGVTVRLDKVNKQIRDGYYGLNTEINEATQQHAIFTEIMQQTAKFTGQEAEYLKTTAGQAAALQTKIVDLQQAFGELLMRSVGSILNDSLSFLTGTINNLMGAFASGEERMAELLSTMNNAGMETRELVTTYAGLITKTNLTTTEQDALKTVTQQLAELVPSAVTAWNEYGEAVEINTGKIEAYVEAQQQAARADFLRSVENLRDSWKELSEVDTAAIAAGLSGIRQEIEDAVGVAGALPKQLGDIDPFMQNAFGATQQANIDKLNTALQNGIDTLRETKEEIGRLLAVGSTAYPELTTGTTAYKEAVTLLGQEFADQIIAFQEQSEQQLATTAETQTGIVALHSESAQSIIGIYDELHEGQEEGEQHWSEFLFAQNRRQLQNAIANIKKENAAFLAAEKAKEAAARKFAQEAGAMSAQFANSAISMFGKTKREADQIWKDMAAAFMRFFIKKALAMLLPGGPFVSGLLGALKIFDVAANDRMAMQMGRDYVSFFAQGANQAMAQFTSGFAANLSPAFNGSMRNAANGPATGTVINITVSADVDEGSVRNKIAPILEELANNRFTNIMHDESTITGESAIEFA